MLQLEELDEAHPFARGRDVAQRAVSVGEHDARFRDVDELDATFRESMQELDDVVVVDERVGELDENAASRSCSRDMLPLSRGSGLSVRTDLQGDQSRRRRPAAISAATSPIGRSCEKAYARRSTSASSSETPTWTEIRPVA